AAPWRLGEGDRSIEDYELAITFEPRYVLAYNNRGSAYSSKGDLERAVHDYAQAIRLAPSDAAAYNNRGLIFARRGELDRAMQDYRQAGPPHPRAGPAVK